MAKKPKSKSIKLVELINFVNDINLHSYDSMKSARETVNSMLTTILLERDAYAGFGYLNDEQMKESKNGKIPGIIVGTASNAYPDGSRRRYFVHPGL